MAAFFRGGNQGLRTFDKDGHREIFIICSDILCGRLPTVHEGLQRYAAAWAMVHVSWTSLQNDIEQDKIRTLDALGRLMSNETDAATVIETLGVDYTEMNEEFESGRLMGYMAFFAKQAVALRAKLSATTLRWADSVVADVHAAFEPLARGHSANWFQAQDLKSALRSFKFARSAVNMVSRRAPYTLRPFTCGRSFILPRLSCSPTVGHRELLAWIANYIHVQNAEGSCSQ